jgi:glycosyltransferase involved in cell wall biosynthesis
MAPKYSVVIPTMNRAARLCRALDSVLRQPLDGELEVVVVDNHSEDDTLQVLSQPRYAQVRVIQQPTRVPRIQNFTTAFHSATGDYVAILYDDEEMLADNLLRKGKILDEHPEVIAVTSSVTKRDFEGNLSPGVLMRPGFTIETRYEYLRNTFEKTTGGLPPFLMRRSAVNRVQLEPRDEPLDDNAFILRLSELGSIATLPEGFVTDTITDAEMIRNGLLEPFSHPSLGKPVPLPGVWFYWCQYRFRVEHLITATDLSQQQIRSLHRIAQSIFRQGIWKAMYHRLMIARQPGPALRLLLQASAFNGRVLIPPVWFFLRWKLTDTAAPIPTETTASNTESLSERYSIH